MRLSIDHVPVDFIDPVLASRNYFVLSSRMDREQFSEFFFGTGFGSDFIVRYKSGFSAFKQEYPKRSLRDSLVEGSFVLGEYLEGKFCISTDPLGMGTIFVWQHEADWVVSNSLFILAREMEKLGYQPEIYPPALAVFSVGANGRDYGQIVSQNTAVKDAIFLPSNFGLEIEFSGEKPRISKNELFEIPTRERDRDTYVKQLVSFVNVWRDRFYTLRQCNENISLSLSGGKDSRAILALLKSSVGSDFYGFTKKNKPSDEDIANTLLRDHASEIKARPSWLKGRKLLSPSEIFAISLFRYAGVKRSNIYGLTLASDPFLMASGGSVLGLGAIRNGMRHRIESIPHKPEMTNAKIRGDAVQEYMSVYADLPFAVADKNSKLFHYAQYRARLHYGNIPLSSLSSTLMPLFSRGALDLALSAPSYRYLAHNSVNYDIMNICAPELLNYPFTGDSERVPLVSEDCKPVALPDPRLLECYSGPPPDNDDDAIARVDGPSGQKIIRDALPDAISRFGEYFEDSVLNAARDEVANVSDFKNWQQAGLLCNLLFLFPEST